MLEFVVCEAIMGKFSRS